jgi:pantetheine-phosphate adenylyltransferase
MTVVPVHRTIQYMSEHIAIYAGSFDPITSGHLDVISRARGMFDCIIVGIGHNPDKTSLFPSAERVEMATTLINELVLKDPNLAPVMVKQYDGLTVDFAKNSGASALLRGIRNVTDLAMETQLAITNRQVADMETVFIMTGEAYAYTSSSLIRQIAALGGDVERLSNIIPPLVVSRIKQLQADPTSSLHSLGKDAHME